VERCGGLDSFCSEQWIVWELREQSNECRKFLNWWSFLRQPAAWVSLTGLKVLILAVCRYPNACGYCMGRWVSTSGWKMYIGKQTIVWHFIAIYGFCTIIVSFNCK